MKKKNNQIEELIKNTKLIIINENIVELYKLIQNLEKKKKRIKGVKK